MTTPRTSPKPIYSLFQHSVHAWRNTTIDDLDRVINEEDKGGKEQLKKKSWLQSSSMDASQC